MCCEAEQCLSLRYVILVTQERGLLDRFLDEKQKLKHRMGHFIQVPGQAKTLDSLISLFEFYNVPSSCS